MEYPSAGAGVVAGSEDLAAHTTEDNLSFNARVVFRRICSMDLPIAFTLDAYKLIDQLCDEPGRAVVLLIDCLQRYEGRTVGAEMIAALYPEGFYRENGFRVKVEMLRARKVPWANVY